MPSESSPRPDRTPHIRDVAREAGVSTGTVSRVLNGSERVAEHRREAVMAAVEKLQYRRHPIARALRSGSTRTIGIVVRSLRNQAVAEMVERLSELMAPHGYNVVVAGTLVQEDVESAAVDEFLERRYDAVVAVNPNSLEPYHRAHEAGSNVVAVLTDRGVQYPFATLLLDYSTPAASLFDHLYSLGHRRVNYVSTPQPPGNTYFAVSNLPIVTSGAIELGLVAYDEAAEDAVASLVAGDATALLVRSEVISDVLQRLSEEQVRFPEDISLAISGHAPWRGLLSPPLDAIEVNYAVVAGALADTLLSMLAGQSPPPSAPFIGVYHRGGSVGAVTPPQSRSGPRVRR